ncbi:MAG: hypothetical protein O2960_15910, partial [Verrucomicrobia bacterium]|nr:hypothetical protein [Verrucomicrobiota bacterium]
MTQPLLQSLRITNADTVSTNFMPEFSLEQVRHRAEATYGAVANTGRFRYAPLGVFCIIMAIALIAAAVFIPSANYELAGSGALVLAIGVMLIFLFDPNPAVRHV